MFHPFERAPQQPVSGEPEVRQLLGEARVHVVQVRDAEPSRQPDAEQPGLLVRMDRIVLPPPRLPERGHDQVAVEQDLGPGRPDGHARQPRRTAGPDDAQIRQRHVRTKRVRDEVHKMPQLYQRLDPVVLAEGRAAGLEEGLRRQHQYLERARRR